jgi:hypothetical protein
MLWDVLDFMISIARFYRLISFINVIIGFMGEYMSKGLTQEMSE